MFEVGIVEQTRWRLWFTSAIKKVSKERLLLATMQTYSTRCDRVATGNNREEVLLEFLETTVLGIMNVDRKLTFRNSVREEVLDISLLSWSVATSASCEIEHCADSIARPYLREQLLLLRGLQCNGTKLQNCTKIYNIKLYMLLNP